MKAAQKGEIGLISTIHGDIEITSHATDFGERSEVGILLHNEIALMHKAALT